MYSCRNSLIAGLQILNLPVDEVKVALLLDFVLLIEKWNKVYNLTAIRNREEMIRLHILDSLAILPYLQGRRIIDIGTGPGLPGIPLAIFAQQFEFVLLDSNAKKTRFVQQALLELKLNNIDIRHKRVEDMQDDKMFNTVLSRAFSSLQQFIKHAEHLLSPNGVMLAMKGQNPDAELQQIDNRFAVYPIRVPGIDAQRCLVQIQKSKKLKTYG